MAETQLLTNMQPKNWPPMTKLQDYLRSRCGFKFSALTSADLKLLVQTVVQASTAHLHLASAATSMPAVAAAASSSSSNSSVSVGHCQPVDDAAQMVEEECADEERGEHISADVEEAQLVDMTQGADASDCLGASDEFDVQS